MNRSRMLQRVLSRQLLLDLYSGAVAAYSLRYLSSSFEGNDVILVRRSSDNAEQGFTPNEIADGTLTSFCGAGDGFVKTWYDQALSNNVTQATAGSQPKIVSVGSLITQGGKPTIDFDGVDDFLLSTSISLSSVDAFSFFSVLYGGQYSVDSSAFSISDNVVDTSNIFLFYPYDDRNSGFRFYHNGSTIMTGSNPNDYSLFSYIGEGLNSRSIYRNGNILASNTDSFSLNTVSRLYIGRNYFGQNYNGKASSLILYDFNQSSNRSDIEKNINNYYNVF